MEEEVKRQVIQAVFEYKDKNGISSDARLAKAIGVNPSYVSAWANGKLEYKSSEEGYSAIGDVHYTRAAKAVGYALEKQYWSTVATHQLVDILYHLEQSRERGSLKMIIGESGCGKTYSVNTYCQENPEHIYRITLSNTASIYDVIDELTEKIGLSTTIKRQGKVVRVIKRLQELADKGVKPQIVMDECENVKLPILGLWKGMYDQLIGRCSIVLLGTPELQDMLKSFVRRQKVGAKQFARRAKAGTVRLQPIDRTFSAFFQGKDIDQSVRSCLLALCDNYGELNDYLEPALRAADEDEVPLTEQFFLEYWGITRNITA